MLVLLLLVVWQAVIILAYKCPTDRGECVGNAHCQWSPQEARCVNSLPCSLEQTADACAESSWACEWLGSSCTSRIISPAFETSSLFCVSLSAEDCKQHKTCMLDNKSNTCKRRPTIIISLADDMGWNDIGWNNPRARTPVLDAMRANGATLTRHYTARFCAPTRAMLLTGVLPWRLGHQTDLNLNPVHSLRCSSVEAAKVSAGGARVIAEVLREEAGYSTHLFGKWHMGNAMVKHLPIRVGFDTFLGFYGGGIGNQAFIPNRFFAHQCSCPSKQSSGYGKCKQYASKSMYCTTVQSMVNDTRQGQHLMVDGSRVKEEGVDLFLAAQAAQRILSTPADLPMFLYFGWAAPHNPVYAPDRFKDMITKGGRPQFGSNAPINQQCELEKRLTHLAMITMMDESHRIVIQALEQTNRQLDTVLIFLSDNGGNGPVFNNKLKIRQCSFGSNFPLRGNKFTWWEGGIRTVSFAYAPQVIPAATEYSALFSATDWKNTLLDAAGVVAAARDTGDDSISRWLTLTQTAAQDATPRRTELALQVWLEQNRYVIIYEHQGEWWKIIRGYPWSGTGAGTVGIQDASYSQGYILQPPELPSAELNASLVVDYGKGRLCKNRACIFNLAKDFSESVDLGRKDAPVAIAGEAKQKANALINKYKKLGGKVINSGLCLGKAWFAANQQDVTDKNAVLLAKKCAGWTAWLTEQNTARTDCSYETQ